MAELGCDGGCSYGDGPQEECSAHGRTPRDLWGIIGQLVVERDAALSTIAKVREAVSGHPECDRYEDGDTITCGWKNAYASVVWALEEAPEVES